MATKYVLLALSLLSASIQPGTDADFLPVQVGTEEAFAEVTATVTLPSAKSALKPLPAKKGVTAKKGKDSPVMWDNGTKKAWITAYSSTPDQTDDTPFITASGKSVADGIIATNHLKFGTKVKIPAFFGDKVFIVEDRMHPRKKGFVDIWMPTREAALQFGLAYADIVVLD